MNEAHLPDDLGLNLSLEHQDMLQEREHDVDDSFDEVTLESVSKRTHNLQMNNYCTYFEFNYICAYEQIERDYS